MTAKGEREVLPATIKPSNYKLTIQPNFEAPFEYTGTVVIEVAVVETTNTIVANALELSVKSAKVVVTHLKTQTTQEAKAIAFDKAVDRVSFEFENEIPAGATAALTVEFTGTHNDKMVGFYRSAYKDQDGNNSFLMSSQFEATDARRAFPCWDEPNLKATFDVTLIVDRKHTALSNMDVVEEKDVEIGGSPFKAVVFATTPIMSTYLLAFAVGDFDYVETTARPKLPADAKPITVRVYGVKGQSKLGHFSLDVAAKTLEFFSEYFNIAYPLPKMDMIGIPDFGAGAMENWGLVTYREVMLFFDEKTSSSSVKQSVAYVVGHELAHQWFGNLVTMDWWGELWLNEGFATFVGWLSTDHLFPEWKIWTQFVTSDFARGISLDSLRTSHPIEVDVKSPAEISQIFDAISYSKGASVIRMLNAFLGGNTFMNGVRAYLKKFAYANATTIDLWTSLSEASGQDVVSLMKVWTRETGYPIVSVLNEKFDAKKQELSFTLRQSRFLMDGEITAEEDAKNPLWHVPITIVTHINPHSPTRILFKEKDMNVTIPYSQQPGSFWKINYETTGFYRVNLNTSQQSVLAAALNANLDIFTTQDRIGIVSDAFASAKSGIGTTDGALEVVKSFVKEQNYMVLKELSDNLTSMSSAWFKESDDVINGLHSLIRSVFAEKVKQLGFDYKDGEEHLLRLKRTLVITAAFNAKDEYTTGELKKRFAEAMAGKSDAIHPELRGIGYIAGLSTSDNPADAFESLLNIITTEKSPEHRLKATGALGATNDLSLIKRLLNEIALDSKIVRSQDIMYVLSSTHYSSEKKQVLPILWEWLKANWTVLNDRYNAALGIFGHVVSNCVGGETGYDFVEKVESWVRGDDLATAEEKKTRTDQLKVIKRPLDQNLEKIRNYTKWIERDRAAVTAWVSKNKH